MRGRPPKPNELKLMMGNPGHRALNDNRPTPSPTGIAKMPRGLSVEARRIWRQLLPKLVELGLGAPLDADALAVYCTARALWARSQLQIEEFGVLVKTARGTPTLNPFLKVAHDAESTMLRCAEVLGLTSQSRLRLFGTSNAPLSAPTHEPSRAARYFEDDPASHYFEDDPGAGSVN